MKKGLIFLVLILLPQVLAVEEIKGYVNDYANILTPQEEAQISDIASALQANGSAEYAVVTIQSLGGRDIEGYAFEMANGHLGNTNNNGLLLLVSLEDRSYYFAVGRGLEPILNDAKVGRIGRNDLVPNFREGNYGAGILAASKSIQADLSGESAPAVQAPQWLPWLVIGIFAFFILLPLVLWILTVKKIIKSVQQTDPKRKDDHYFMAAMMAAGMFGRGGSGGFGGGGFGGFGGGSFGGGGAGGHW